VLDSALAQFPVIGDQIGTKIHSFHGSVFGLIIGIFSSFYGGLGVVQAIQNALNKIWGVPRNSRPNPITARLRSLLLLAAGGAGILATTVLSALTANADSYGSSVRAGAIIITLVLSVALFTTAFRVLTARPVTIAQVRVGAVACAVIWQMLQWAGTSSLGFGRCWAPVCDSSPFLLGAVSALTPASCPESRDAATSSQ
jgi:membrane protein